MSSRTTITALLAAAALTVGACGDDEGDSASTQSAPAATVPEATIPPATQTATTPAQTTTTPATTGKLAISKDRSIKPAIPKLSGDPPAKLVVQDVVKGKGKTVKLDDNVTVNYVGVSYSSGEEFDASWNGGQPATFQLSQGQLIDGWVQGIPGMKVGGRRVLIIPPELGYGASGSPPAIAPNETLVFVIDMEKTG